MAESITYLNVPYAQKDAAKALGARWDAVHKKWYVPAGKDVAPFAQWHADFASPPPSNSVATATTTKTPAIKNAAPADANSGVFTYPTIPDFAPYAGEEPPWD